MNLTAESCCSTSVSSRLVSSSSTRKLGIPFRPSFGLERPLTRSSLLLPDQTSTLIWSSCMTWCGRFLVGYWRRLNPSDLVDRREDLGIVSMKQLSIKRTRTWDLRHQQSHSELIEEENYGTSLLPSRTVQVLYELLVQRQILGRVHHRQISYHVPQKHLSKYGRSNPQVSEHLQTLSLNTIICVRLTLPLQSHRFLIWLYAVRKLGTLRRYHCHCSVCP